MTEREVLVTVLFFAGARDLAGVDRSAVTLTAITTPEQLLAQVVRSFGEIAKIRESVIISLNQEYCEPGQWLVLSTGDEVAIIPPISGGMSLIFRTVINNIQLGIMDYIKLTQDVLSVEEITGLITNPSCGAISLFVGTTRNNFQGKNVVRLEYEAYHEMAEKEMGKLIKEARNKWSLKHIALYHRLGLVPVTESSVIVAVSSEHRRESLDAVSFLIDNLKANVPIWKKEVYSDGSDDWKKNKECVWVKEEDGQDTVDKIINNNKST
ncbi:Molybdopterin synthase catalytic subunit-like [Homarus americanus]|uniref:Molybdopterin synthase catalytic subunit n=1 Tax=Homarus americanus TaxID=6706 RepID=A0A8J5JWU4_HOMAM|nr:Molybdopterin synthase catalytic subunit-like [Homarus americanus]